MKNYLFGYGSLLCPESINTTLKRKIPENQLFRADLQEYARIWNLIDHVIMIESGKKEEAVFLNVIINKNSGVNGVMFEITDEEIENFDNREKNYERVDVTDNIFPKVENKGEITVYTYVGKSKFLIDNFKNPIVLEKYHNIVLKGLSYWGEHFSNEFFKNIIKAGTLPMVRGDYQFLDKIQNSITGRSEEQ